jgi:ADP-ribose pyrophosphatase YjhB (NUDIX family)
MDNHCSNCGKGGHSYNHCKSPVSSFGVIAYRYNKFNEIEYLQIYRKDTIGFIDFMRGKYNCNDKKFILNLFKQMTFNEKVKILQNLNNFDFLWNDLWGTTISYQYKFEETHSKEKFETLVSGVGIKYNLEDIIDDSMIYEQFDKPECGFPKGRKNLNENDFSCAVREFQEETGYCSKLLHNIHNIYPLVEVFMGSNFKSYLHKYYLCFMDYNDTITATSHFQESEISSVGWFNYNTCIQNIRPYNLEKKKVLENVNNLLLNYTVM